MKIKSQKNCARLRIMHCCLSFSWTIILFNVFFASCSNFEGFTNFVDLRIMKSRDCVGIEESRNVKVLGDCRLGRITERNMGKDEVWKCRKKETQKLRFRYDFSMFWRILNALTLKSWKKKNFYRHTASFMRKQKVGNFFMDNMNVDDNFIFYIQSELSMVFCLQG